MSDLLTFSKALADETRLRLVAVLAEQELAVGEIVQTLSLRQSRISRHLKILADSGLLAARRDGQWVFYRSVESGPGHDYLKCLAPFFKANAFLKDVAAAKQVVASRAAASARFFTGIAADWEQMRAETLGDLDLAMEIKRRMGTVFAIADLGCGPGRLLAELAEGAQKVIGVDQAQGMLDEARKYLEKTLKNGAAVSLRIGQLEHLPMGDGEVQFAVMCLALHHLSAPEKGIREAQRVLSAGGRFVLADFDRHNDETLRTKLGDRWLGFAPEKIEAWLTEAGFNIIETVLFPLPKGLNLRLVAAEKIS